MTIRISTFAPALVVLACLAGCTTPKREPVVITKPIYLDRPVPCQPKIPAKPAYVDSDQALAKLTGQLFERVKLLLAGREQRSNRENVLEEALAACAAPLPPVAPAEGQTKPSG